MQHGNGKDQREDKAISFFGNFDFQLEKPPTSTFILCASARYSLSMDRTVKDNHICRVRRHGCL